MLTEFKDAISKIKSYNDIIEVLMLYYFNKKTLIWYKHLIDNKMAYTKQSQIGILYNKSQSKISDTLRSVKNFITKCTNDLDVHRNEILDILNYAEKHATKTQCDTLVLFMQHKSFAVIGDLLGVSRQSAWCTLQNFIKHFKQDQNHTASYNNFMKIYNLTK